MDEQQLRPTSAADVALPIAMVTLKHLQTRDGAPVVIRCESIAELVIADIMESLPGGKPKPAAAGGDAGDDPIDNLRVMSRYAPRLIEAGTVLEDGKGGEVRPAFYFDELDEPAAPLEAGEYTAEELAALIATALEQRRARPRHRLSIPGRLLREEDKISLVEAILGLGGYMDTDADQGGAGAAASGRFPAAVGSNAGDGAGAGDAGADERHDAVDGPA